MPARTQPLTLLSSLPPLRLLKLKWMILVMSQSLFNMWRFCFIISHENNCDNTKYICRFSIFVFASHDIKGIYQQDLIKQPRCKLHFSFALFSKGLAFSQCGVTFMFSDYFVWCYPFGKCNLTFRVLQSWPQFQVILNSRILISQFWSLNLRTFYNGLTFFPVWGQVHFLTLFRLILHFLANVIYPSKSNFLIEWHVFF